MNAEFYEAAEGCQIQDGCAIGLKFAPDCRPVRLGKMAEIRRGTIIYANVQIGDYFQSGHHVLIREKTVIGDHVVVGTNTVIDGNVTIGDFVKIESNCYIPTHVKIGNRVFFGPNVTLTNDRYPLKIRDQYVPEGPIIEDGVTLGAGVVVCPGVRVGHDSFVAAGCVVTRDVPPHSLVMGVPGRSRPLPEHLRERNMALSWKNFLKP
jgi:acetyltransferase-like isoleucine patch superfamily enzyme